MKRLKDKTDFEKLKVGDSFLSISKNKSRLLFSIIKSISNNGFTRELYTLYKLPKDKGNICINADFKYSNWKFFKLTKKEKENYLIKITEMSI
ncbi:unnamed protein product [marine sediment metagenome]|uniref:Uncharacterized protein n=1 Tax=marine sediment metagenome TaxID=412755 RepID=X0XCW1_9ZZZZ